MSARPRLLDLCCKAGGATKGYQQAGFYVVGVDVEPQPNLFAVACPCAQVRGPRLCRLREGPLGAAALRRTDQRAVPSMRSAGRCREASRQERRPACVQLAWRPFCDEERLCDGDAPPRRPLGGHGQLEKAPGGLRAQAGDGAPPWAATDQRRASAPHERQQDRQSPGEPATHDDRRTCGVPPTRGSSTPSARAGARA